MKPWKRILCPIDFSNTSRVALRAAAELAASLGGELTLLHSYQLPGYALPEGVVYASPTAAREMLDEITKAMGEWQREAEALGATRVTLETAMGTPHDEILRVAKAGGYDVIVIGTHGRTGLSHVILGSVAERVVRRAPCPVLTIRAIPDEEPEETAAKGGT